MNLARHMEAGGSDYRQRLTVTLVPGRERRYKEIYCLSCSRKLIETYDDIAYVSDVSDISNITPGTPSLLGFRCPGTCHIFYEFRSLPGTYDVEFTKLFFLDPNKKRREVHCHLCKELFCVVTLGSVYGLSDPFKQLVSDTNGFVPTYCPGRGCEHEYEITTYVS